MKQSAPAESEHQQRDSTQRKPTDTPPLSQTFVDNRESTQQMRQMRAAMNNSPQAIAQRKLSEQINNSPRMIAQRQQFAKITGAVQRMEGKEAPMQGQFQPVQRAEDEALLQGRFDPVQRVEEEESLQGKFDPVQRVKEDELLQGKFETTQLAEAPAAKQNNTGLPGNLKSGIEHLSGLSMDHVKVHYNSSQPAQLNALAYAQGTDIHVAPGQEKHLPHEAWHVVQQAQGRVKPTMQMAKQQVNDDRGLEKEADLMGERASSAGVAQGKSKSIESDPIDGGPLIHNRATTIQMSGGSTQANEELRRGMGKKASRVVHLPNAKPHTRRGNGSGGGTDHQARNANVINKALQDTRFKEQDPGKFSASRMRGDDNGIRKDAIAAEKRQEKNENAPVDNKMKDFDKAMVQATTTYKDDEDGFNEYLERKKFNFTNDEIDTLLKVFL